MAEGQEYFGIRLDTDKLQQDAEKAKKAFDEIGKEAEKQGSVIDKAFSGTTLSINLEKELKNIEKLSLDAFGSISSNAQRIVREIQEDTLSLSNVEKMMSALNSAYEKGTISQSEYINAASRLEVLHRNISSAIQQNEAALKAETTIIDKLADDSMTALQAKVTLLTAEYMKLSKAQRESIEGDTLLKNISEVNAELNRAQATMSKYGTTATGQFNMLNVSIQQIARELPSLTMSPQMFFLAISNNLPMFTDALANARKEFQAMTAAGKEAVPVWKQVAKSLLSWQTALSLLPTLLIVYSDEIGKFFESFVGGGKKIDVAKESIKVFKETMQKGELDAQKEVTNLNLLYDATQDLSKSYNERKAAVDALQEQYPSYFKNISDEEIMAGNAADAYTRLSNAIIASAKARAAQDEMVNQQKVVLQNVTKINEAYSRLEKAQSDLQGALQLQKNVSPTATPAESNFLAANVATAAKAVRDIENEIANYRTEVYKAEKITKELQSNINIEDLMFDTKGSEGKKQKAVDNLKQYLNELLGLQEDNEERQIELTKQGTEKQLALIELRYSRQIAAVKKLQEQLKAAQGGKLTGEQQGIFDTAISGLGAAKQVETTSVIQRQIESEKKAMQEYLIEYGNYWEKRKAITEKYQNEINRAIQSGNIWEASSLSQKLNKELQSIGDGGNMLSNIEKAFGNLSSYSKDAIEGMISTLEEYRKKAIETFDFASLKEYEKALSKLRDAQIDNKFGVFASLIPQYMKEQLSLQNEINDAQELANNLAIQKLELSQKIKDKEAEILTIIKEQTGQDVSTSDLYSQGGLQNILSLFKGKDTGGLTGSISELLNMKSSLSEISSASSDAQSQLSQLFNMKGSSSMGTVSMIDMIVNGINDTVQGVSSAIDNIKSTMDALGKDTDIDTGIGKLSAGMQMFSEASQGATNAWNSLKSGNIGGVISGVTQSITAWIKGFAGIHDAKNEKRIEKLQDQIEVLTNTYDKLGKAVEDAYSKDASNLIEDQNKLLEQQKVLIQNQIKEEQDKKKTDEGRIKEWQQQLDDINEQIEENKQSAIDAIFGEDLKSAIENFADALTNAWSEGTDASESARDMVKQMMQQMVSESIKAAIQASGSMEEIRKKLQEFYADNVLTGWEQDYIYNMADKLQQEIDKQFGWAEGLFGTEETGANVQTATAGGFETMSQDTANELNGRFTALYESSLRIETQISIGNVNLEAAKDAALQMRDLTQNCYLELVEIRENTGAVVKPIQQMQKDITEMKNTIKERL